MTLIELVVDDMYGVSHVNQWLIAKVDEVVVNFYQSLDPVDDVAILGWQSATFRHYQYNVLSDRRPGIMI